MSRGSSALAELIVEIMQHNLQIAHIDKSRATSMQWNGLCNWLPESN